MMEIPKSKTLKKFTILNNVLVFLIKLNKTAVQSVPNKNHIFTKWSIFLQLFLSLCQKLAVVVQENLLR